MASKREHFRHLFGGGWATDFGPSADVSPTQTGDIIIPYLLDAENVFFELDGGPHKIGGTSKLNSSVIESGAVIRGLFDYWRQGTSASPAQRRVVFAGTKILADNADGTFAAIKTGLESGKVPSFSVFNDDLIMATDSTTDVPQLYDGTTCADLGGTPPNFAFSCVHKNHVFAAGDASNPSRLYYSRTLNAEDWTHSSAGHIDIDPDDGDRITGIASHKNSLWVFKGPYKGSIHRINGSANSGSDAWTRVPFIHGLGAVNHNTIFRMRDDLGFMWSDGSVHSLAATAAYGDFNESSLLRPIHRYLREHLTHSALKFAWAETDVARSLVVFTVPVDTSTDCNNIIVLDYARQQVWLSQWPAYNANCVARVIDASNANQPNLMIGGRDGYIRRTNIAARTNDGSAITAKVTTPHNNLGSAIVMKTLAGASVGIAPKGDFDITFGWTRDDNAQQTDTVDQGGGDVLGVASANQFTLNSSALGGAQFVDRFLPMESGGEFRSIAFQLLNAGNNEDMEVHSISIAVEVGAQSQENA